VFIEWLRFQVKPELRERFVQKDTEIWTAEHANRKGFLQKEVWISPKNLSEVVIVIHWATQDDWYSIPKQDVDQTEKRFAKAFGGDYKLVESAAYQIRKTFQNNK
jgi:uncharacterized protein (TIGR03792 family)